MLAEEIKPQLETGRRKLPAQIRLGGWRRRQLSRCLSALFLFGSGRAKRSAWDSAR